MDEIKRCPFRKDGNGDFAPCYGSGCMAYLEYDRPAAQSFADYKEGKVPPVEHMVACSMMPQQAFYSYAGV